jgi:hypothetical protein
MEGLKIRGDKENFVSGKRIEYILGGDEYYKSEEFSLKPG